MSTRITRRRLIVAALGAAAIAPSVALAGAAAPNLTAAERLLEEHRKGLVSWDEYRASAWGERPSADEYNLRPLFEGVPPDDLPSPRVGQATPIVAWKYRHAGEWYGDWRWLVDLDDEDVAREIARAEARRHYYLVSGVGLAGDADPPDLRILRSEQVVTERTVSYYQPWHVISVSRP